MEIKREHHINFWYVVVAFIGILFIQELLIRHTTVKTISYSEFQSLLEQQKLDDIVVGSSTITGKFKTPESDGMPRFSTMRVDTAMLPALTRAGITFYGEAGPGLLETVLGWFMPAVGFFLLWMVVIRPMLSGQGGVGGGRHLVDVGDVTAHVGVRGEVPHHDLGAVGPMTPGHRGTDA